MSVLWAGGALAVAWAFLSGGNRGTPSAKFSVGDCARVTINGNQRVIITEVEHATGGWHYEVSPSGGPRNSGGTLPTPGVQAFSYWVQEEHLRACSSPLDPVLGI